MGKKSDVSPLLIWDYEFVENEVPCAIKAGVQQNISQEDLNEICSSNTLLYQQYALSDRQFFRQKELVQNSVDSSVIKKT